MTESDLYKILETDFGGYDIHYYLSKIKLIPQDYEELGISSHGLELSAQMKQAVRDAFYTLLIETILNVGKENMNGAELSRVLRTPFSSGAWMEDYLEDCMPSEAQLKSLGIDTLGYYWNSDEIHNDFYKLLIEAIVASGRVNNV